MTKDYYEVLGVRRSASAEEIELAFKGRRTQYHPDKYSQSDAQTLQWATEHMQAVNEAYTVLSDAGRRSGYDQRMADKSPHAEEARPTAPSHRTSLQDLLRARLVNSVFTRIYFAPNIPLKKLSAALGNYAGDVRPEDVLVLVDTTVFGGSKEGMLLTETALRVKEIATPRRVIQWSTITTIQASEGTVYVGSREILACPMVEKHELTALCDVLNEFVQGQAQQKPEKPKRSNSTRSEQAREADKVVRPKSQAHRNALVFRDAKERLVYTCKGFEPIEEKQGEEFVDRANAAGYFGYLSESLEDPQLAESAHEELQLIAHLCEQFTDPERYLKEPGAGDLAVEQHDDSQLVAELRSVLRLYLEALEQVQRKADVDRFFGR